MSCPDENVRWQGEGGLVRSAAVAVPKIRACCAFLRAITHEAHVVCGLQSDDRAKTQKLIEETIRKLTAEAPNSTKTDSVVDSAVEAATA